MYRSRNRSRLSGRAEEYSGKYVQTWCINEAFDRRPEERWPSLYHYSPSTPGCDYVTKNYCTVVYRKKFSVQHGGRAHVPLLCSSLQYSFCRNHVVNIANMFSCIPINNKATYQEENTFSDLFCWFCLPLFKIVDYVNRNMCWYSPVLRHFFVFQNLHDHNDS